MKLTAYALVFSSILLTVTVLVFRSAADYKRDLARRSQLFASAQCQPLGRQHFVLSRDRYSRWTSYDGVPIGWVPENSDDVYGLIFEGSVNSSLVDKFLAEFPRVKVLLATEVVFDVQQPASWSEIEVIQISQCSIEPGCVVPTIPSATYVVLRNFGDADSGLQAVLKSCCGAEFLDLSGWFGLGANLDTLSLSFPKLQILGIQNVKQNFNLSRLVNHADRLRALYLRGSQFNFDEVRDLCSNSAGSLEYIELPESLTDDRVCNWIVENIPTLRVLTLERESARRLTVDFGALDVQHY